MAFHYDLTDFRVFVNVVEARSLTRGAERSCLSVPATSNRIKNLEDGLGLKLLERSPQGITLTPEGQTYLKHARAILSQIDLLTGDLQEYVRGIKGKLRLLANTTAVTEYLPPVIGAYLKANPDVQIDMVERLSGDIVRLVREGAADIGVVSGNINTDDLQTIPFVSSKIVVIAPEDHEILRDGTTNFEHVLDFDHVSLNEGCAINMFLAQHCEALNRSLAVRMQVTSYDAMFRMVEAGAGIAVVPLACFERLRRSSSVGYSYLSNNWAIRDFRICARDFGHLSKFAANFVDALVTHYDLQPVSAN